MRKILLLVMVILLSSCNESTNEFKPTDREIGKISGVVFDAPMSKSTVAVYEFQNKKLGKLLGTAQTNPLGEFAIDLKTGSMPLYIEAKGGSYLDPYTLKMVDKSENGSDLRLITYLNYNEGSSVKTMLTPLTYMAAGLAEYQMQIQGKPAAAAIKSANQKISALYGLDVISTTPIDITSRGSSPYVTDEHKYGALLTAYSSYAYEKSKESPAGEELIYTSYNLADIQYRDIKANGLMDGKELDENGHQKQISFGHVAVNGDIYTNNFSQHLLRVVNDSEINKSGTPGKEYETLAKSLNTAENELIPGRNQNVIDEDPPTVKRIGKDILARKDRVTVLIKDYIGIAEVNATVQYQSQSDQAEDKWVTFAQCEPEKGAICSIEPNTFKAGDREAKLVFNLDLRQLDSDDVNALKARMLFTTSDVLSHRSNTQTVDFEWDGIAPIITIDTERSPATYNPNLVNIEKYQLVGMVKDIQSGLVKPLELIINGNKPELLECTEVQLTRTTYGCAFEKSIPSSEFINGNGLTQFKIIAKDNNQNKSEFNHSVYSDTEKPILNVSFPTEKLKFIEVVSEQPQEIYDDFNIDTFQEMFLEKYLKINYMVASAGIMSIDGVDFDDLNEKILTDNYIPFIKVTVRDTSVDLNNKTGSLAENLVLKVRYEAGKTFESMPINRTITTKHTKIPHKKIAKDETGNVGEVTYFIPFTKDIFGDGFKGMNEDYQQRITVTVTDDSGNESDPPFVYNFRSTFNLPKLTVYTPFLNAKANFYRISANGSFQSIGSCNVKPLPLPLAPQETAVDLASCSILTPNPGEVHRVALSGEEVSFYQWSKKSAIPVNLMPVPSVGPNEPISAYINVENSKDIYLTELSVFQSGFFDYLWNGEDKTQNNARLILDKVNSLFYKESGFFGFNPISTRYATNEDLKRPIPPQLSTAYQHRFLAEAINGIADKNNLVNSAGLAKKFYEDFSSDGLPNGKDGKGQQIRFGGVPLKPEIYREGLARAYYKFLTTNTITSSQVDSSMAMSYANLYAKAAPTLNGMPLFNTSSKSIDDEPPLPDVSLDPINSLYKNGKWYFRKNAKVSVDITDPSGFDESKPTELELFWTDDENSSVDNKVSGVQFDKIINNSNYEEKHSFSFNSQQRDYPGIKRLDLLVSTSDTNGNSYGFGGKDKYSTIFMIDNEAPRYEYHPPYGVVGGDETFINLKGRQQHKLLFKIIDTVGEDGTKRKLQFRNDHNGITHDVSKAEMSTDANYFSLILCTKATCPNVENQIDLADGKWELYVEGRDLLGNGVALNQKDVQHFKVFVDSTPPIITSDGEEARWLGGNQRWSVNTVIDNGEENQSSLGDVSVKLYNPDSGLTPLEKCDGQEEKCQHLAAYQLGEKDNTIVKLIADNLNHSETYKFEITALDAALPPNKGTGSFAFKVDKQGPEIELDRPAVVDNTNASDPNTTPVVGRHFFVSIKSLTDDSEVSGVSLWQLLNNGSYIPLLPNEKPNSLKDLNLELLPLQTDKIQLDVGNNINLVVKAKDKFDFVSQTNSIPVIFDKQGPEISLKGYNEEYFYAPGYNFDLSISDIGADSVSEESVLYWEYTDPSKQGSSTKPVNNKITISKQDSFKLKVYAEDIRGNANDNAIFNVKVDKTPPEALLTMHYANVYVDGGKQLRTISENEIISEKGPIRLTLEARDPESGIADVKATFKVKGAPNGSDITFVRDPNKPNIWTALLTGTNDGSYGLEIKVRSNTKINKGDGPDKKNENTVYRSININRTGYELSIKKPDNFSLHRSGKKLNVEFSVVDDNLDGLVKLQCWIRENWTLDDAPADTDTAQPYVSYDNPNTAMCSFPEFDRDYLKKPLVLITKTTGTNGSPVVQKFSFDMIDITPPEIENKDSFELQETNVFTDSEGKKLKLIFKVTDNASGIDSNRDKLRLVVYDGKKFPPKAVVKESEKTHLYVFTEKYEDIIDKTSVEQSVSLEGIRDNAGNIIGDSSHNLVKLIVPAKKPAVIIEELKDGQWINGTSIKFKYRYQLPENSKKSGLTVALDNLKIYHEKGADADGRFGHITWCEPDPLLRNTPAWECNDFTGKIPDGIKNNKLQLSLAVTDLWNNRNDATIDLHVDNTRPVIEDSYSLSSIADNVVISFDVKDPESKIAHINYNANLGNANHEVEKTAEEAFKNMEIPLKKLEEKLEGLNSFKVDVTAFNNAGLDNSRSVAIDITKPDVVLELPGLKFNDKKMLTFEELQPFKISSTPKNANSKVKAIKYKLQLEAAEEAKNTDTSGPISDGGVNGNFDLSSTTDGQYQLKLVVGDNIGREITRFNFDSQPYDKIIVLVDRADPEIKIISHQQPVTEETNGQFSYIVKAKVTDANLDEVTALLTDSTGSRKSYPPIDTIKPTDVSGEYMFEFRVVPGTYKLNVSAKDLAGKTGNLDYGEVTISAIPKLEDILINGNQPPHVMGGGETVNLTFNFSEDVSGFEKDDVRLESMTGAKNRGVISNWKQTPGNQRIWTATYTSPTGIDDEVAITVENGSYTDTKGRKGLGNVATIELNGAPLPVIKDSYSLSKEPSSDNVVFTFDVTAEGSQLDWVEYEANWTGGRVSERKTAGQGLTQMEIPLNKLEDADTFVVRITAKNQSREHSENITVDLNKPSVTLALPSTYTANNKLVLGDVDENWDQKQNFTITATSRSSSKAKAARYKLLLEKLDGSESIELTAGDFTGITATGQFDLAQVDQEEYQLKLVVFDNIDREITDFSLGSQNYDETGIAVLVDKEKPLITDVSAEQLAELPDGKFYRVEIKARVSDKHLDSSTVSAKLTWVNGWGNTKGYNSESSEVDENGEYTFVIKAEPYSHDYRVVVTATDMAGRESRNDVQKITVASMPTLDLAIDKEEVKGGEIAELTFTFSDKVSKFDPAAIRLLPKSGSETGTLSELKKVSGYKWTATYTSPAGVNDEVTIKVDGGSYHNSGGVAGIGDEVKVTVTAARPPVIEDTYRLQLNKATNNVELDFDVTGGGSDLKQVEYAVNAAHLTKSGEERSSKLEIPASNPVIPATKLVIPTSKLAGVDRIEVTITAINQADEMSSRSITVDLTPPAVELELTGIKGDYNLLAFKADQQFKIRATSGSEAQAESYQLLLESTDGGKDSELAADDFTGDTAEGNFGLAQDSQGKYQLRLVVTDNFGRKNTRFTFPGGSDREAVLVDMADPEITDISVEQPEELPDGDGKYSVIIKARVSDNSLIPNTVRATLSGTNSDSTVVELVALPSRGVSGEYIFEFRVKSGSYEAAVIAGDLANRETNRDAGTVKVVAAPQLTLTTKDYSEQAEIGEAETVELLFSFTEEVNSFEKSDITLSSELGLNAGTLSELKEVYSYYGSKWTATYTPRVGKIDIDDKVTIKVEDSSSVGKLWIGDEIKVTVKRALTPAI